MELITKIDYKDATMWVNEDGELHRKLGPAVIWINGDKEWYKNNKLHREDGPAVVRVNGENEWWLDGIQVSEKTYESSRVLKTKSGNTFVVSRITSIGRKPILLALPAWEI